MRLAFKLISVLVLGITTVLAAYGYSRVEREVSFYKTEMQHSELVLGLALKDLVVYVWRTGGQRVALEEIERANAERARVSIRWVWLDAPPEDPYGPSAPKEKLARVWSGRNVSFEAHDAQGEKQLYTYIPIEEGTDRKGALEIAASLSRLDEYIHTTIFRILSINGFVLLLSILAVVVLGVGFIGRPLRRLIEKTRRVGRGDLATPLQLWGHDELSELASALNAMCDQLSASQERVRAERGARIEALDQLRHGDRLKTVGRLASGVAHELGTPLNVVSGRANLILTGALPLPQIQENAVIIRDQAKRMTAIIQQLLDFARRRPPQKSRVDLRDIIGQTLGLMGPFARRSNVTLESAKEMGTVLAKVDVGQMQQVITNLVLNAVQAMPSGGKVGVALRRETIAPPEGHEAVTGAYVCIAVTDEGEGILPENLEHVFEPFFTTKDVGEGTGLGLSIAYGIVREHGGWIDVTSQQGKGSCFSVYLPAFEEQGADGKD